MSDKGTTNKSAAPRSGRRSAEPAYDLFDSLRQARLKAKQSRQKTQSPADDQARDDGPRDEQ